MNEYLATVTITMEFPVSADTPEEAEAIAFAEVVEEFGNMYPAEVVISDPSGVSALDPEADFSALDGYETIYTEDGEFDWDEGIDESEGYDPLYDFDSDF